MENFRYDEEPLKIELMSCALDRIFVYIFSTILSSFREKNIVFFWHTPIYIYNSQIEHQSESGINKGSYKLCLILL